MRSFLILFVAILLAPAVQAQDLNCKVQVISASIQNTDKQRVFETLKNSIFDFMNNRKWTPDIIQVQERIECTMILNVTEWDGSSEFKANLQLVSSRPVFNSSYNSTIINLSDKDIQFTYTESQALDFAEAGNKNNLTSLLAFYAYFIVGLDYDTFSLEGGTPYFQKAQTIVNDAQNLTEKGWKAYEDTRNRYWLVENMLSPAFKPFRLMLHQYHRLGLDKMNDKMDDGRKAIMACIPLLQRVNNDKRGAFMLQIFFSSKSDELVNIFSKASSSDKAQIVTDLSTIDPANGVKYQKILAN